MTRRFGLAAIGVSILGLVLSTVLGWLNVGFVLQTAFGPLWKVELNYFYFAVQGLLNLVKGVWWGQGLVILFLFGVSVLIGAKE